MEYLLLEIANSVVSLLLHCVIVSCKHELFYTRVQASGYSLQQILAILCYAMCIVDICRAAEPSRSDESAADGGGGRETPRHDLRPRHGHPGGQGCRDLGGALQPQGHVQAAEQGAGGGGGGGKGGQEVARG